MSGSGPNTVIAIYRVRRERRQDFLALLARHPPRLRELGLVTDEPPVVYVGEEEEGGPVVFEIFTWKDAEASGKAHHMPEVGEIWGPLGEMTEARAGRPQFEFPHVARHRLGPA